MRGEDRGAAALNGPGQLVPGQVVAAFGRHVLVETALGRLLRCQTRRKHSALACGDRVMVLPLGRDDAVVEAIEPRATLLLRASAHRAKLIAANATQAAVLVAAEPSFSDELVARALVAAANAGMKALLVLNKVDLEQPAQAARERLQPFREAGYPMVELSALRDASPVRERLQGETTTLVGQSGMGKSTLVNALFPGAGAATREISKFLDSGKHTTTAARLYRLDPSSALIDSPGMQEFGLAHLSRAQVESAMPELSRFLGHCRFAGCRHLAEPGCAIKQALEEGAIHPRRFELFQRIVSSRELA